MSMKHIVQDGMDGFGHQLEGLWTCLILHNVDDIYFDARQYIKKQFSFHHIDSSEQEVAREYLTECLVPFIRKYNEKEMEYKDIVRTHELWEIPLQYEEDVLYSLDNVFYYKLLFPEEHLKQIEENIQERKNYFINDTLPKNRLHEKNIVIHIRMNDAMYRYDCFDSFCKQMNSLVDILKREYPDHVYYIHSDGVPVDIITHIGDSKCIFFGNNTPVMDVLSDFVHANIFVCGESSLSFVSSYFGEKQLILVSEQYGHSMPNKNVYSISDYIKKNTK